MSRIPNAGMGMRIPSPGGSQPSPAAGPRKVLLWSWLMSYLVVVIAGCLSVSSGPKEFAMILGVPPVVLFIGLSILGHLTPRTAWVFMVLWLGACGAGIYVSLESLMKAA